MALTSEGRGIGTESQAQGQGSPNEFAPRAAQREIEMILGRQLAGYLALPIVIIDANQQGTYYNEPAEVMLGRRFDEGGPIPWTEWASAFQFTDDTGDPVPAREMPLATAVRDRRPAHRVFWLRGLDGIRRHMDETAIPIVGHAGRFLGAVAFFNEIDVR